MANRTTHNRLKALERRAAELRPPRPGAVHRAVVATWRELRAAIKAARAVGARLIIRHVVDPAGGVSPSAVPLIPREAEQKEPSTHGAPTAPTPKPPSPSRPDPHGFSAMSEVELLALANNTMPLSVRRELEAELNRRADLALNPPPATDERIGRLRADADEALRPWWRRAPKWWLQ